MWKGYFFQLKEHKVYLFCQNGIQKKKDLNLGAEPPHRVAPCPQVLRRSVRTAANPHNKLCTLVMLQALLIAVFQKFVLSFHVGVRAHQHSSCPSYRKWEPIIEMIKRALLINLVRTTSWTKSSRTFQGYSRRYFQYTFHGLLCACKPWKHQNLTLWPSLHTANSSKGVLQKSKTTCNNTKRYHG